MTLWEGVHPVKTTINFTFRFLDYDRLRPEDETTCTDGTASIGSIIKVNAYYQWVHEGSLSSI